MLRYRYVLMISCLLVLVLISGALPAVSQPPPSLPGAPEQAPLNGGLIILAASGLAYAWKKLRNHSADSD